MIHRFKKNSKKTPTIEIYIKRDHHHHHHHHIERGEFFSHMIHHMIHHVTNVVKIAHVIHVTCVNQWKEYKKTIYTQVPSEKTKNLKCWGLTNSKFYQYLNTFFLLDHEIRQMTYRFKAIQSLTFNLINQVILFSLLTCTHSIVFIWQNKNDNAQINIVDA